MLASLWQNPPAEAATGINKRLNFQGRLLTNAGAVVADGNYNMRFKIYQDGNGILGGGDETLKWTEIFQNSNSQGVVVRNGYFSVALATYCPFDGSSCSGGQSQSNTAIDWNQDTLWLSMDVTTNGTDTGGSPTYNGEMSPFKRLSSAAYAMNAGLLGGLSSSGYVQNVAPNATQQTANINILSGAAANVAAAQIQGVASATAPVLILKGGATPGSGGDLLQFQSSSSTLGRVDRDGNLFVASAIDTQSATSLEVGTTNATSIDLNENTNVTGTLTATSNATFGSSGDFGIVTLVMQSQDNFSSGLRVQKRGNGSSITGSVASGAELGYHEFYGWDGSAYSRGSYVIARTTEAWTGSARGTSYSIATTPNGTTTSAEVLTLGNDGAATFKNSVNSAASFQIQNTSSNPLLTADTETSTDVQKVQIGDTSTANAPVALVLDHEDADLGGSLTNGMMYYNTATDKFRCYQATAWTDCISTSGGSLQSAYNGGATIETASNTAVLITETTTGSQTGDLLQLVSNVAASGTHSGDLLQITMDAVDANALTGHGIHIEIDQSQTTGDAILVEDDGGTDLFRLTSVGTLTVSAANAQTTAITVTDTDYTNALSIGDNNITGTTANIDLTNFDVVGSSGNTTVGANGTLTVSAGLTSLTGNTSGDALNVSNSTSTGNIALFKDNSTTVLTIANEGAVTLKNSSNSTTAFQIQNASTTSLFTVDTTNSLVNTESLIPLTSATRTPSAVTTVDSTGDVGQQSSLVLGSDGFGRISYYDSTNGDLKFVQCTNAACTTKNTTTVDSTGTVGGYPSLALGSDGFGRISYHSASSSNLKFAQCTNAACTTSNITTVDSSGFVASNSSLVLGSDGFGRISYYEFNNNDLKFVQCTNAACTTKNTTTVDSTGTVGQQSSLALGSDQFGRISYLDGTNGDLKFVQCTNAACTTSNITTVDSTGAVGYESSLALASDGFGRISYYDSTNGNLKFVQCTNAACTTSNITAPDSPGNVGFDSSLVLGSDEYGRISYVNNTNGDLKFAQCTNAACTTSSISTVDSSGLVGYESSLALGSDGFGRISYYDSINGDLKFAQLVTASGAESITGANIGTTTANYGQLNIKGLDLQGGMTINNAGRTVPAISITGGGDYLTGNTSDGSRAIEISDNTLEYQTSTQNGYFTVTDNGAYIGNYTDSDAGLTIEKSGTGDGLFVVKSDSGYLARFNSSFSDDVFTIDNDGAVVSTTTANSTTAFQIQNAIGSTVVGADTTPLNTIVNNGSIEGTDVSNWANKSGTGTPTRVSTQAYIGSYSMQVVLGTASGDSVKYTPSPALTAATYAVSFYLKQTSGTAFGTNLAVGWNNGSDSNCTLSPTLSAQAIPTAGWARYTCTFTGSTTGTHHLYFKQTDSPGSARTFFIDGLQLELASSAKPFTESKVQINGVVNSPMVLQNTADSTTAFQIQNAAGTSNLMVADTLNGVLKVGTIANPTMANVVLYASYGEIANVLRVGDGTDGFEFDKTNGLTIRGAARPTKRVTLVPEYPGATMTGDGSSNSGTMTSDFCSGSTYDNLNTAICSAGTDEHNYYKWVSSSGTNDYDIIVRYRLPKDFSALVSSNPIKMFGYRTSSSESVKLTVSNATNAACGDASVDVATGTAAWSEVALTNTSGDSDCTGLAADQFIKIRIKLTSSSASNTAAAGELYIDYLANK